MRFSGELYPAVGFDHNWTENQSTGLAFDLHTKAFTLRYTSPVFGLSLTSDRVDIDKAQTFGLSFNALWPF